MLSNHYQNMTMDSVRWIERRILIYGTLTGNTPYGLVIHIGDGQYLPAILERGSNNVVDSKSNLQAFLQKDVDAAKKDFDIYIPMWSLCEFCPQIKEAVKDLLYRREMTSYD